MSALGKVFTIIVFLAACVALGVQSTLYMQTRDYRMAYDMLEKKLQAISRQDTEQILALRTQVDQRDEEIQANREVLRSLKQSLQDLGKSYEETARELTQRSAEFGILLESHRTISERLGEKEIQIDNLQANLKQAKDQRDEAYSDKETAEQHLAVLVSRTAMFEEDNSSLKVLVAELQESLSSSEWTLDLLREKYDISLLIADLPAPPIDAKVVYISNETSPPICTLSVGEQDGVRAGYTFTVYRGQEFVGRVIVEQALADVAHCRVLFTKDGSQVSVSDSATTR